MDWQVDIMYQEGLKNHMSWLCRKRADAPVLRNPVRPSEYLSVVAEQISVVCQRKCRHPKSTSGRYFEGPLRQQLLQLIVDEGVFEQHAAAVRFQYGFDNTVIVGRELLVFGGLHP